MTDRHAARHRGPEAGGRRPALDHGVNVLVADGEKALLMENAGDADRPVLRVVRESGQQNPPRRDQGTDRPGRMPDSGPGQRSALEETDWHRLEKTRFAKGLARMLCKRVEAGEIRRLIVAAPPDVLGDLRAALHRQVADRVIAEIAADYTNHPVDAIERRLAADLAG